MRGGGRAFSINAKGGVDINRRGSRVSVREAQTASAGLGQTKDILPSWGMTLAFRNAR